MAKTERYGIDAKHFKIVTLSRQKSHGKTLQYRVSIPPELLEELKWEAEEKLIIEIGENHSLHIRPITDLYIQRSAK
jgi:hypothetical protein